ncbi:conserved hypothetical protein [Vibrio owensii]|uniref:hypothetical protein n=1 Tax=Vibrio owensii TaxID=696485 RepID=UPI0028957E12|nr:conserved hypothetical protein [Vibrio owensii]CAH1591899.1 conserved hypothetical protein [Vibrio owensii]
MEEEFYRKKTEGFEVCTDPEKGYEPLMTTSNGTDFEPFETTTLEKFTEVVKATEKLADREKSSVLDYVSEHSDIVSDGLESFIKAEDAVINVHSYLMSIFPDFPDLAAISDILVEIMLKIAGA